MHTYEHTQAERVAYVCAASADGFPCYDCGARAAAAAAATAAAAAIRATTAALILAIIRLAY